MKNNFDLSIIIPIYKFDNNKLAKFLKDLNFQKKKILTHVSVEIIIVSNSVSIKNNLILKKNTKYKDFNFYVYKDRGNPGLARNYGLKKSFGNFVIFLDFNDNLKLINVLTIFKKFKNEDFVIYKYKKDPVAKNNNLTKKKYSKRIIIQNLLKRKYDESCNYYFFKKKFLIKNKIYFDRGFYEDRVFILKVFFYAKNFSIFNKLTYKKIRSKNSITQTFSNKHILDFIQSSKRKYYFLKRANSVLDKNFKFSLQHGLRGDFYYLYKKIINYDLKKKLNFIKSNYLSIIDIDFEPKTLIDNKVKKILKL
jgi:hypothetical protein